MYYEEESGATGFVAGILVGAVLGASIALLMAPHSGKITRARLVRRGETGGPAGDGDELDRHAVMAALKQRRRRAVP